GPGWGGGALSGPAAPASAFGGAMAFGGATACGAATAVCTVTAVGNVAAASSNSTRPALRPARPLASRPARQGARWRGPNME
ncbi:MAG: hypothetical protein LW834_12275, partial [Cyanobium sp. 49614_E6]|nr:hypothetical protein [Cyanobium sp. 49614_E6]